jgi:hypothetical protein
MEFLDGMPAARFAWSCFCVNIFVIAQKAFA